MKPSHADTLQHSSPPAAPPVPMAANKLRQLARKIGYPAGDIPAAMLAAADEIDALHVALADLEEAMQRIAVAAAAAEREACAKVCEEQERGAGDAMTFYTATGQCAAAIRARNQPPKDMD